MAGEFVAEESGGGGDEGGAPAWMATFADMMSLLLCFFVLLLSFANMDIVKFEEMLGSVKDALGVAVPQPGVWAIRSNEMIEISPSEASAAVAIEVPVPKTDTDKNPEMERMKERLDKFIDERRLDGVVEAVAGQGGVTIRVKGTLMFNPASDELRMGATPVLEEIADLAQAFEYNVAVQGHTDDVPIKTARFPSNWELSAARAVAGLRYLITTGKLDPSKASATGFAHTRPIAEAGAPGSRALNRRLEFVFYRADGSDEGAGGADAR